MLRNVHTLDLINTRVTDVSMLIGVHTLFISKEQERKLDLSNLKSGTTIKVI